MKWFKYLSHQRGYAQPRDYFHELIRQYMPSGLLPPFNEIARAAADMDIEWYQPLVAHRTPK